MSAPQKFRKKPVVIEAMQWDGDSVADLKYWTGGAFFEVEPDDRTDDPDATGQLWVEANGRYLPIVTGEWVIKDSKGFYPCKADVFAETYEATS